MNPEFASISFTDPAQAARSLDAILSKDHPALTSALAQALQAVSDPLTVLVRMDRLLACSVNPNAQREMMANTPRYLHLLCTILDQSHYLTDILCRNPGYTLWLWQEGPLHRAKLREEYLDELAVQMAAFDAFDARCQSMRRYKRREILRIATRDIVEYVPLDSLTEDLSNLADAMLETAIQCGRAILEPKFGKPHHKDLAGNAVETGFVILAMGKLGGRELNFSSDIDLVFVYADEGSSSGGTSGTLSNVEYFHKLGEYVITGISKQTDEDRVFRVDMRLRPHGRMGPLAIGLESALHYYEQSGQAWERQALIKARPAAGDADLGQTFIERTRPFVFPRYFDDDTLNDIIGVKRQMEAKIAQRGATDRDVKLGRGGIRDIEFTVQILQLLNGGKFPELRTSATLEAIQALGKHGCLSAFDASALESNYVFLRRIEHRLQVEGSQQRHEMPAQPEALDLLAKRLGYTSGPSFLSEYHDRAEETRRILERFINVEASGHLWVMDLLDPRSEAEHGLEHLAKLNFRDPARARESLLRLGVGPMERPYSVHIRRQFTDIAPQLIEALGASSNPDITLVRLERVLSNLRAPNAIYDILKWNPALAGQLVTLVSNSEYLCEILARDPGLFDMFGSGRALNEDLTRQDLERLLDDLGRAYDAEAAPYRLRDGELLRIGLRELLNNTHVVEVGHELTRLAEVCLTYAVNRARARAVERYGPSDTPFAVLGLGKLGGREMNYGSDLDLVFVYGADAVVPDMTTPVEYFAYIAAQTIRQLKEPARFGLLYDIDARLRPDGNKGMLAISAKRIDDYYQHDAQAWELLALTKVRAVAGDIEFGKAVEERARKLAFGLPLTKDNLQQIEAIRRKIVQNTNDRDIKKGEGGLAEVEFTIRLLQLRHVALHSDLRRSDALGALDRLAGKGLIPAADFDVLAQAYFLFRKIENRIRMMHGRSASGLPADAESLDDLARRLHIEGDLLEQVGLHKTRVHALYMRLMDELMAD